MGYEVCGIKKPQILKSTILSVELKLEQESEYLKKIIEENKKKNSKNYLLNLPNPTYESFQNFQSNNKK